MGEFFFFLCENPRFVEHQNRRNFFFFYARILVLWKTRIGEIFFSFFFIRESSFCGKPELEKFFIYFFFFMREFSVHGKPEWENFFFFFMREFLFC